MRSIVKKIMKLAFCVLAACGAAMSLHAQDVINTVVGGGPNGIPGIDANLYNPYTTAVDASGNVYVAAESQHRVFKINTSGIISVVAGNGTAGYSGDGGLATKANLYNPQGVAVDSATPANVYIGDTSNCLVRKVNGSTGIITTIAGLVTVPASGAPYSSCGYTGNGGAANAAELYSPTGIAINTSNNDLYIAEYSNGIVRKVAGGVSTGTISLVAGSGGSPTAGNNCQGTAPYGDGSAATAGYLCYPQSVTLDQSTSPVNVIISEYDRCDVREVVGSSAKIYQLAGSYTLGCGFTDNVKATSGQLNDPWQTHVSVSGGTTTVQVADYSNARIRQFTFTYSAGVPQPGTISTIAGKGSGGFCGDNGPVLSACMNPVGLSYDSSGNYYIGDYGSDRLRKVTKSTGYISTIGGWGANGGTNVSYSDPVGVLNDVGVPALYYPVGVYADPSSSKVYVGGYQGEAVYVWDSSKNEISNFAGSGVAGFTGDGGLAASVGTELYYPAGIAKDKSGNIYIADYENCDIREVSASTGDITTIAGGSNGVRNGCGYTGDGGTAVNAQFNGPYSLAIDGSNNIYVADYNNCAIRKITASSDIVTTVAGGLGCGFSGDNGPATKAKLYYAAQIALDGAGNLYVADYQSQRIRKISALSGNISTVAGTGQAGYTGDGQATGNDLYYPTGVASDANGNLFIADQDNEILRWVTPTGQMITFAGTPSSAGFSGDGGSALKAQLYEPQQITVDNAGNMYTADYYNQRIRQVTAFAGYGLSTSSLNFETQAAGTTSNYQELIISAIGPTTISSIKVGTGYSEIDDCVGAGALSAGESCSVDVYFEPTSTGNYNSSLTIGSNALFASNPNTVSLSGTGAGLKLTGSFNYYTVPLHTVAYHTLTLKNSASSSVTISKIYLAQASAFYFGSNGTCPRNGGSLAAGASCTIPLNFSPKSTGGQTITLVVDSNDPASPLLAQAQGIGTEVKLSASSIAFGTIKSGTTSTMNLTISNTGTASYTLSAVITGSNFSISSTGKTCGSSLAGGASCVLPIEYAPTSTGTSTGSLKLTTNGGSSPTVALSGTAD
jgi:sugar lactone lactonase YvrE